MGGRQLHCLRTSRAPKCRAADDLLMACELHPAYAEARAGLAHLITRDLIKSRQRKGRSKSGRWRSGTPSERIDARPAS